MSETRFDGQVCKELTELIDREADLLNRGRSEKALEGLRKRISRAFLSFVEDPRCNPEAVRHTLTQVRLKSHLMSSQWLQRVPSPQNSLP